MRQIELFMWGYQPHFRATMEILTKRSLELIGIEVEPAVLLVGLGRSGRDLRNPVCIEPEDGNWPLANFANLPSQVEGAINAHPMQNVVYGDKLSMSEKPEIIRRRAISEEVARLLRSHDDVARVRSFCSTAYPIDDYYVVCIIQVPDRLFRQFPPFRYRWQNEDVETSFLDECLRTLLGEAVLAMSRPDPGRSLSTHDMRTAEEIIARAARSFMRIPFIGHGNFSDMFEQFNRLSQLMYEGHAGSGSIVLAASEDPNLHYVLRFADPVPLRQARWARKILQMATRDTALIVGYESIFGLGRVSDVSAPPYCVDILGHNRWDFRRGDQVLLRTHLGEARLPQEAITTERFVDNMGRVFVGISEDAVNRFRIVLNLLVQQRRGSLLIIASDAAAEAARLYNQGTSIKPTALSKELLERATSIDGAILADPDGVCHAVGVILDGAANEECTPSRGSRYNSALRYVGEGGNSRMAFVVSEDRTVDVIPLLRKKASRKKIEQAVDKISTATIETYHKARSWLETHRFYLNAAQCLAVNEALDRIESAQYEAGSFIIVTERFEPHPAMNESYLD